MEAQDIVTGLNVDAKAILGVFDGKYDPNQVKVTINKLANDLDNYDNMCAAGRLLLYDATRACGTVEEYASDMKHRLDDKIREFIMLHAKELEAALARKLPCMYRNHDLFSASTMVKTYLMKPTYGQEPLETPLHMYLRCAIQFYHEHGLRRVIQCFDELAEGYYTPASPTLFNAGTKKAQMSSCFLVSIGDDLESILYTGTGDAGMISRLNGGLGINLNSLRHSMIGDVGMSSGIIPVAKILDKAVAYVDQGGKRPGACTVFIRPWHIDMKDFIKGTDNYIDHAQRFSTINTCLWMSDLFFKRADEAARGVKASVQHPNAGKWTVFCPAKAKVLNGLYGYEFEAAYIRMEAEAPKREAAFKAAETKAAVAKAHLVECQHAVSAMRALRSQPKKEMVGTDTKEALAAVVSALTMPEATQAKLDEATESAREAYRAALAETMVARKERIEHHVYNADEIFSEICRIQTTSGMPYIMHGDTANWKSNQKNLGAIDSSNLCVAGDTPIFTRQGYLAIKDVVGKEVEVWNGDAWSKVTPKKTGENQKLVEVCTSNGGRVCCTPYHKFLLPDGKSIKNAKRIPASELKVGMELLSFRTPPIHHDTKENSALIAQLCEFLRLKAFDEVVPDVDNEWIVTRRYVPTRHDWSADVLTLQTLGIQCEYVDGKLVIPHRFARCISSSLEKTINDGSAHPISVISMNPIDGVHDTYCFTEPFNNAGMFGGILTGQCLEVIERSTPDEIASCNLSSTNVARFSTGEVKLEDDGKTPLAAVVNTIVPATFDAKGLNPDSTAAQLIRAFDFQTYGRIVGSVVENLDQVIDSNYYPLDRHLGNRIIRGKISSLNFRTRPLGIGVSGFMDAVLQMDLTPEDDRTMLFNKLLFACQYFNGLAKSVELAIKLGAYAEFKTGSYKRYDGVEVVSDGKSITKSPVFREVKGSPLSNGQLQFDLWAEEAQMLADMDDLDTKVYDRKDDEPIDPRLWGQRPIVIVWEGKTVTIEPTWDALRKAIMTYGVRHSLLFANMPTASTAQTFRNSESCEVHQANTYQRNVISGTYTVLVRHLVRDLEAIGAWSPGLVKFIAQCTGSVKWIIDYIQDHPKEFPKVFETMAVPGRGIPQLQIAPAKLRRLRYLELKYRTMFEVKQKRMIQLHAHRARYICQSSSHNIYLSDPSIHMLKAVHTYAQRSRVKTGMYYLRQNPAKFAGSFNLTGDALAYFNTVVERHSKSVADSVADHVPRAAAPPSPHAPSTSAAGRPPVKMPLWRFTSEPYDERDCGTSCSS